MHILMSTLLASALAIGSVAIGAQPADAAWTKGWFHFGGGASTMTRSFNDGSPRRTPTVLFLQKKAGPRKCRAQVIMRSGGYVWKSQYIYKYTRNLARAYAGTVLWPSPTRRTTVTVKTNGRCIFRVNVK